MLRLFKVTAWRWLHESRNI